MSVCCMYIKIVFKIKIFLTLCSKRLTESTICSHIKKSNLHCTRSVPFRVSRMSGSSLRFAPRPAYRSCGVDGGVWDLVGSGFRPRVASAGGRRLTFHLTSYNLRHLAGVVISYIILCYEDIRVKCVCCVRNLVSAVLQRVFFLLLRGLVE